MLLRVLAILALILCVHAKMVDLDCALHNPLHCQTLYEGGDNHPGDLHPAPPPPPPQVDTQPQLITFQTPTPGDTTPPPAEPARPQTQNRPPPSAA